MMGLMLIDVSKSRPTHLRPGGDTTKFDLMTLDPCAGISSPTNVDLYKCCNIQVSPLLCG